MPAAPEPNPSQTPAAVRARAVFEALGLAVTFDLSRDAIERAYLARAAALHPDRARSGGGPGNEPDTEPDVADAAHAMAALNAARAALADPERRANLVLDALGGPSATEDKSLPPGFLMDVMELRQQIEADLRQPTPDARARWQRLGEQRRAEHARAFAACLDRAASTPDSLAGALADARRELNAWRYTERLLENLDAHAHAHAAGGPAPRGPL